MVIKYFIVIIIFNGFFGFHGQNYLSTKVFVFNSKVIVPKIINIAAKTVYVKALQTISKQSSATIQARTNSKHNTNGTQNSTALGICRLRHGLNENCLIEVFNYLEVRDLIQICEFDVYYQDLIEDRIIF